MKNNFNRFWAVLCLLSLGFSPLFAERVSETDAALVANHFMNGVSSSSVKKSVAPKRMVLKKSTAPTAEQPQYYIYENADGEGWVMVAANDIARPILAYSDEGQFRTDNQPENIKHWLGKYNKQIKQAEEDGVSATEEVTQEWKQLRKGTGIRKGTPVVAALIKTKWDQEEPYRNMCPQKGTSTALTGCVATAMAQVMNYWQWPVTGTGSNSVTFNGTTYTVDFSTGNYDWDNMLDKYSVYYDDDSNTSHSTSAGTTAQKNAVAKLMYHCGVAANMEYGTSVSGAYTIYPNKTETSEKCAQYALEHNFGYKASTLRGYYRPGGYGYGSAVSDDTWHNLLKTELDAARPIMYAGADSEGGHSFICDGYDNTTPTRKYHFNWGWSGYCDGYYDVDNLVPGTGGSGAGNGSYNDDQDIIIGIIPDKPDVTITWSVQGATSTTKQTSGTLVLPASTPSDCSGSGGKKFVGWTAQSSITGGTRPTDLFTSGSGITVTENKTYYAVYATAGTGGSTTPTKATSIAVGDEVILVYENGDTKKEMTGFSTTSTVYGTVDDYTTTPAGTYTFEVVSGNSTGSYALKHGSVYANWSSGNSLSSTSTLNDNSSWNITFSGGNAVIANVNTSSRTIRYNTGSPRFACYTSGQGDVQLYKMGSGTTYSDYSLTCGAAVVCALTGITLNTSSVTKSFYVGDTFNSDNLVVTASYSNCADATVTPTTVSSPDMSTTGEKTITVSYTESGNTETETYKITVNPLPTYTIRFYDDGELLGSAQTVTSGQSPTVPSNPAGCTAYTFVGWWTSALATTNTTSQTWITDFTATKDQDYYAVYSHSSGSGGGAFDGNTTGDYKIYADVDGTKYYATGTGSKINSTTTAADATAYTFAEVTGGWSIKTGDTYITYSSSTNLGTDSEPYTWTISGGTNGTWRVASASSSSRAWIFRAGTTEKFGGYATSNVNGTEYFDLEIGGSSGTTYYTTDKDCTIPTTVTVTFYKNDGTDASTSQTIPYNTSTALTANSFSRTGYTFQGWATSATGTKAYDDGASVTLTSNTPLYAVWQKNSHDVTFNPSPTGATVTINSSSTSPKSVEYGETVTIAITPDAAYEISSVTATGVEVSGSGNTRTFTMPDADVTVTVTMAIKTTYAIRFFNNGTQVGTTQNLYVDQTATPPADPTACEGYTFYGWWTEALATTNTEAHKVTDFTVSGAQDYYAVFSKTESSGSGIVYKLVSTLTDAKDYIFVTRNTAGNGYAFSSAITTGTAVTIEESGSDKIVSGTPATTIIWTAATGWSLTTKDASQTDKVLKINGSTFALDATGSTNLAWTTDYGLNGKSSGTTKYYLQCTSTGTFSKSTTTGSTTNRVWAYEKSTGSSGTTYYTTAPDCTECTNKVTLTKGTPSNGSFALDKEDGEYNNCSAGGLVVTVSGITPASGYQFKEITQTGISSGVTIDQTGKTVTYDKDVTGSSTINVEFELIPTYTVTWSSNGDDSNTATYHEGEAIVFPTSADGCDTKTFMGWVSEAIPSPQDNAPTYVTSATMGTSNLTYYAVFADEDGDGETYKLVSSLTNGKEYIFVNRNTDGNGYALSATFSSNQNTGTAVSITTSGSDKIVSGTPGNAIIWIASTGWSLKNKSTDTYLKITGSAFELNASGSTNLTFNNANYGLNGQSGTGSTKYYVQCEDGVFTKSSTIGSTSNRVWAYEKSGSTAYSGYTTSCVIPTEVTVTFDANGGTGTMAAQTIPYNSATALTANAFTREGYTFQGWATSSTGDKVHNDQASVTLKKNTTLYAVWQKNSYTITIDEVAHATIVTSPASTAEFEATVTVTVTPASGYTFGSITVTNNTTHTTISTSGTGNEQTFTMPASDVTVTATVNEIAKYTVTWSMDGDISTTAEYEEGQAIVFPTTATGCDGRTFMGWVSEAIATPQDNAPTYVTSATMPAHAVTYYAVYAEASTGSGAGTWTETAITDLTGTDIFAIVGNDGSDNYALPNNATSTPSAIGVTISDGKITSTVANNLKWNISGNSTDGYTFYPNGDSDSWLHSNTTAVSSSNTNIRIGTGERNLWILDGGQLVTNDSYTDRYLAVYNGTDFRGYVSSSTSETTFKFYKYSAGTSYTGYTTSCGASVNAKNIGWITAPKGQKVKRVINVSAKGFAEATTLTATSGNAQFKVTLGASAVPSGAAGLSTTLTVEYAPTDFGTKDEDVEITLTAGDQSKTITVSGRSLPEEFLLITKKTSTSTWYALPANMTGGANEYDGIAVSPNDPTTPTAVAVSPSTLIYNMASVASSRYADNGHLVRLVGNGDKCLWGSKATGATKVNIQNYATLGDSNGDNYEWDLKTTDGIHYFVESPCNAEYSSGRRLAYGSKFGMYKEETVFYIVEAGCTSQPGDVNVSPRRAEATFSWESNATSMKIDVYTNEGMTSLFKSETATSSPYVMKGLTEETNYWFKLIPTGDEACAVTGSFKTTGPTIDIAEWQETAVVVQIDHGDVVPSIVIDGQEEHGSITGGGGTATELFFAKYFEGAGSMKLVSIFNGTKNAIPLTNYKFFDRHAGGGASSYGGDTEYDLSSLGSIEAGQEIIFFTRPQDSETDMTDCSSAFLDEVAGKSAPTENPRWIECDGQKSYGEYVFSKITFNGNDALLLKKGGDIIDVIGSLGTPGNDKNCKNEDAWAGTIKNMDYDAEKPKHPSDPAYAKFFEESSLSPVSTADSLAILNAFGVDLTNPEINISTARCIFFRDKRVTSGDSAVQMNTAGEFKTFTTHVEGGQTYKAEWYGRSVCMTNAMKTAAGVASDAQATCNSYQDIANMDYKDYYIDYSSNVIPEQTLNPSWKDEETNLYTIPIPEMSKYTCLNLRFQLKREGEVVTEKAQQVPILISDEVDTNDPLFSELVVDKVDENDPSTWTPLYSQSKQRCSTCDVVVLGTGTLTKVADTDSKDVPEVGNVKIYPGGKLVVPDETNYTVNSLSFRRQEDNLSTADIQGNLNIKEDGNHVYFDLRVDPSNWHYIALPYDCNIADIRFVNDEERIPILGTDYLLKYYDGEKRAATQSGGCWEMVQSDGVLKKGIGYIFGIPGSDKVQREFRFPMSNEVVNEEKDPAGKLANGVYAYGGDKEITVVRANHRGWNLLGNPYLLPYTSDIESPVMTGYIVEDHSTDPWDGHYMFATDARSNLRYIVEPVDNGRSEYVQKAITSYKMKPFTSYFVQIGGTDPEAMQGVQFNLNKVDRSASPVRRSPASYEETADTHPVWVMINMTNDKGEKDETTMLISDDFTNGYDMMDDLVKMRGTYYQYAQITTKPVLASRNDEGEMAFNALPDSTARLGIPLNFFAAAQGQYTIALDGRYSLEEVKEVQLYDSELNDWHNLKTEDYVFTVTKKGDNTTRFKLYVTVERKQPQTPTEIDNIYGKLTLTTADRTLILSGLREDADIYVYDTSGKLVAADRHTTDGNNSVWRTTVATQGVYFVRVMTGNEPQILNTIVY